MKYLASVTHDFTSEPVNEDEGHLIPPEYEAEHEDGNVWQVKVDLPVGTQIIEIIRMPHGKAPAIRDAIRITIEL